METISEGRSLKIVIRGEADIANVDHLEAALTDIELDGAESVRIDASDLAFFDVNALRCLSVFARTVKRAGRDVTTCGATPMLRDVARLLEVDDELGLP